MIVQSRSLARSAASASRLASTYARHTSPVSSGSGSSTPIAEICTNAADPGLPGALDRLQRALEVDGALALDVAVRAAAGREHDRLAALERRGERGGVLLLDVEQPHLGAPALELGAVLLLAHQRDRRRGRRGAGRG